MELVYLWVKNYKNIVEQGFNFSPRFRCEYDEEKNELTINENKDYVSIFPDNINVTAIVGENGSGKSSVIEEIIHNINIYDKEEDRRRSIFIQCYFSKKINKIFIDYVDILKNKNIQIISNINYEEVINENNNYFLKSSFFYHYKNDLEYPIEDNKYGIYTKDVIIFTEPNKQNNKINLKIEDEKTIKNMLNILNPKKIYLNSSEFFVPSRAEISFNLEQELRESFYFEDSNIDKYAKLRDSFRDTKNIRYVFLLHVIFYMEFVIRRYNPNNDFQKIRPIGQIEDYSIEGIDDFIKNINFEEFEEIVTFRRKQMLKDNHISIYENSLYLNEIEKTINLYKSIDKIVNLIKLNNNSNLEYEIDSKKLNENNIYLLTFLPRFIKIDFRDKSGKHLSELSSGERSLLKLIYSIVNIINLRLEENLSNSISILLDEIENTLHPNWQKKILNYLISLGIKYNMEFNIIIVSHSPFILSDLPKENVIFLEKDEKTGNCKNVSNRIDINPFGANIHTLLSHGFFMKDGLMGEFAKEKIDLAIKYLNQKILTEDELNYCENIISIIGEPIIKRELQRKLDSKRLSEIELIKKQIAELQQELDKKENKK
ncbi:AAA family ATPase [Aliarcobacter butzleri]|uniref:AAA family ATPase n=1 Tax=Aliarcobacter butzleri TaxID=28197 RepID=UPI003B20F29C